MSCNAPSWILNCVRNCVIALPGKNRMHTRAIPSRNQSKWKRIFSRQPFDPLLLGCEDHASVSLLNKVLRHTSAEEQLHVPFAPSYVNHVLRANELSYKVPEFDGKHLSSVLKFESNQLAANTPNEDRRSAASCLQSKGLMFGVFDGHAGFACAQSISERLLYYIAVSLMSQLALEELEFAMERMKPVLPILQWHKHRNDYFRREVASLYVDHLRVYWQELMDLDNQTGMSVRDALTFAFKRLDNDISLQVQVPFENEVMRNHALQIAFSGATACVAHIDSVHLHVANAGDCRAVLGYENGDGTMSALPLTLDHNSLNENEILRLYNEHPKLEEETIVMNSRLLGTLVPLRAFGDVRFKWSQELQKRVLENACDLEALNIYQYSPPNYFTPPYLTAEPEITYHKLRLEDKFLVIASDGLWDMLDNDSVVRLVAEHSSGLDFQAPQLTADKFSLGYMHRVLLKRRAKGLHPTDQNVTTHLIRHAIGTSEYGEIDQERLTVMLSLPDDLARMYRDDITVNVIYFNSNVIEKYHNDN